MFEGGSFQVVSRRKKSKRVTNEIVSGPPILQEFEFDCEGVIRKVNAAVDEISISRYKKDVFDGLTKSLNILNVDNVPEILCFGLGHFSEYLASKYQLALLIILKRQCNAIVHVHDPIFYAKEVEILESFDLRVIVNNEEGKHRIGDKPTLIYLPHCSKQLTNNFLYANWSVGLNNCILLSNSCSKILDSNAKKVLKLSANYILRICPYITEIDLENSFKYENVFNDFALHVFSMEDLKQVPLSFWNEREEPDYRKEDLEFITRHIAEKLKL